MRMPITTITLPNRETAGKPHPTEKLLAQHCPPVTEPNSETPPQIMNRPRRSATTKTVSYSPPPHLALDGDDDGEQQVYVSSGSEFEPDCPLESSDPAALLLPGDGCESPTSSSRASNPNSPRQPLSPPHDHPFLSISQIPNCHLMPFQEPAQPALMVESGNVRKRNLKDDFHKDSPAHKQSLASHETAPKRPKISRTNKALVSLHTPNEPATKLPQTVLDALSAWQRSSICRYNVTQSCISTEAHDITLGTEWGNASIQRLDSCSLGTGTKTQFFINTGGSIWGISWFNTYVAVGGYQNSHDSHIVGEKAPGFGTIQIWHVPIAETVDTTTQFEQNCDSPLNTPTLHFCVHHSWGACLDLKWWPGSVSTSQVLGYLGCVFADGGFRILELPSMGSPGQHICLSTVVFEIWTRDVSYLCFDWGGTDRLAIGCTQGYVSLYDVSAIFLRKRALLTHFPSHDTYFRQISFQPGTPLQFITCGSEGRVMLCDVREPGLPVMLYRSRGFLATCEWSKDGNHLYFADCDYIVRVFRIPDVYASQLTATHKSVVWRIASSPHHTYFASVGADGALKLYNPFLPRARRCIEGSAYVVTRDPQSGAFKYAPVKALSYAEAKINLGHVFYNDPSVAIQATAWCPIPKYSAWLATGGRNGIVRIDQMFNLNLT